MHGEHLSEYDAHRSEVYRALLSGGGGWGDLIIGMMIASAQTWQLWFHFNPESICQFWGMNHSRPLGLHTGGSTTHHSLVDLRHLWGDYNQWSTTGPPKAVEYAVLSVGKFI